MSRWTKGPLLVALGAAGTAATLTFASGAALADPEPVIREAARWAIQRIEEATPGISPKSPAV